MKKIFTNLFCCALTFGSMAQMTPCEGGFADVYPCANVDMLSHVPMGDLVLDGTINNPNLSDVWGWTDPVSGIEYALVGRIDGTSFVSLEDPENPVFMADLPTEAQPGQTGNSLWRDIKVYNNHAFIVSETGFHGMQVFDLTQLADIPEEDYPATISTLATSDIEELHYYRYTEFGKAHNIVIDEDSGFAYAVGTTTFNGGLHIVDIQNPVTPVLAGSFADDGYTHDAQVVLYDGPDPDYQGKQLAFCANEDTFTIVDVTDKTDTQQLCRVSYPDSAYTHQGWLSEDKRFFYLGDEIDELSIEDVTRTTTLVFNVEDIDAPKLMFRFEGTTGATDHNLYTHLGLIWQNNYRAGLQVIDGRKTAINQMSQVGFFDPVPESNAAGYTGNWSSYPYFESGIHIISTMTQGFFVVRPHLATVDYDKQVLPEGDQAVFNVYISDIPEGAVNINVQNLSNPLTVEIGAVVTPGVTPITISGAEGLALGDYAFDVEVAYNGQTQTFDCVLQKAEPVIYYPVLSDLPLSITQSTSVDGLTIDWAATDNAVSYTLEIADNENFMNALVVDTEDLTYEWTNTAEETGTYYVRVTAFHDCAAYVSEVGSFEYIIVGVTEISASEVKLFPNPATTEINLSGADLGSSIVVLDLAGKIVASHAASPGAKTMTIDVQALSKGMYLLQNEGGKTIGQFVKQ